MTVFSTFSAFTRLEFLKNMQKNVFICKNKIARGDVNIFSHLFFLFFFTFDIFRHFKKKNLTNRQSKIKFVVNESISIEIDTLLACFQIFRFLGPFWIYFSKTRSAIMEEVINRSSWFLNPNSGSQLSTSSAILKRTKGKLRPRECPRIKSSKWSPWRHLGN